jgi:hypothetical protein
MWNIGLNGVPKNDAHLSDRCDVADALVKLKVCNGGFLPGITLWSPQRQDGPTKIVGPAYTVQYAPMADERAKWPSHYVWPVCPLLFPRRVIDECVD